MTRVAATAHGCQTEFAVPLTQSLCGVLQGTMELGDMDDPMNSWCVGELTERAEGLLQPMLLHGVEA